MSDWPARAAGFLRISARRTTSPCPVGWFALVDAESRPFSEVVRNDARGTADDRAFDTFSVDEDFPDRTADGRADRPAFKIGIDMVARGKANECGEHGEGSCLSHDELPSFQVAGLVPSIKYICHLAGDAMTLINPPRRPAAKRLFAAKHVGSIRKF